MATRILPQLARRSLIGNSSKPSTGTSKLSANTTVKPAVATKSKSSSGERNANDWGRCKTCSREYKKTTLERTDYVCTNCTKKAKRGDTGTKKNNDKCKGTCGKEYTKATLKKHDGMCKKCSDAKTSGGSADEIVMCTACDRETSRKISDQNSGFCHTCTMLVMQYYYTDALLKVVEEVGLSEGGEEDGEAEAGDE